MKRRSQVGTKKRWLEHLYRNRAEWEGALTGGEIVCVREEERERVESTWKVFRLRGNAGRVQALTTTNRRNLTRWQISEPHMDVRWS